MTASCAHCGRSMPATWRRRPRVYCSRSCTGRAKARPCTCERCGATFKRSADGRFRRFCSRVCARAAQPAAIAARRLSAMELPEPELTVEVFVDLPPVGVRPDWEVAA